MEGCRTMNQLQIAMELQSMLRHIEHSRRLNADLPDDKVAQGATFAYATAGRRIDALLVKILAEGVEIDDTDYDDI
jgi:hypothetical protein